MGRVTSQRTPARTSLPPPRPGAERQALPPAHLNKRSTAVTWSPERDCSSPRRSHLWRKFWGAEGGGGQWVPALRETSLTSPPCPRPCLVWGTGSPGPGLTRPPAPGSHMSPGALRTPSGQRSGLFPDPPSIR